MKQLYDYINEAAKKTKVPNGAITTTIKKAGVSNDIYRAVYDHLIQFAQSLGIYNELAPSWSVGPGHQFWRVGTKKTISALKKKYYGISYIPIDGAVELDQIISTINKWTKPDNPPFTSWEDFIVKFPKGTDEGYVVPSAPISLGDGVQYLGYSVGGGYCDANLNVTDKQIQFYIFTSHEDVE